MARPGLRHHPYSITCAFCGRKRKAASPDRKYCGEKCKRGSAKQRELERFRIPVQESNKPEVEHEPRRYPAGGGPAQIGEEVPYAGEGVSEGPSAPEIPEEGPAPERVGRQPDSERAGVSFPRSPVSGLMYIPEDQPEAVPCQWCDTLFWGVEDPYICNNCWEGAE